MGRAPRVDRHGGEVYVYRRAGLPCLVCGTPVRTAELDARNAVLVPGVPARPADGRRPGDAPRRALHPPDPGAVGPARGARRADAAHAARRQAPAARVADRCPRPGPGRGRGGPRTGAGRHAAAAQLPVRRRVRGPGRVPGAGADPGPDAPPGQRVAAPHRRRHREPAPVRPRRVGPALHRLDAGAAPDPHRGAAPLPGGPADRGDGHPCRGRRLRPRHLPRAVPYPAILEIWGSVPSPKFPRSRGVGALSRSRGASAAGRPRRSSRTATGRS